MPQEAVPLGASVRVGAARAQKKAPELRELGRGDVLLVALALGRLTIAEEMHDADLLEALGELVDRE
eukprot:12622687-Alexandrium_andersonii.AAC.1